MKKLDRTWEKDGYLLRLAQAEDAEQYYCQNYQPLDPEIARMTGSKIWFSREEVIPLFRRWAEEENRYFFLLMGPEGNIIGESVINEIDWKLRSANFRLGIYRANQRGKGLGTWMVETIRDFAFGQLGLHRLSLDVFSFNPQAERIYRKAGFRQEGVLRDAVLDSGVYADQILMAMLEEEWRELKGQTVFSAKSEN